MAFLKQRLYSRILSNGIISRLDSLRLTAKGGDLLWQAHVCEANAKYIISSRDLPDSGYESKDEISFLSYASYISYIPYGDAGYLLAEKIACEELGYKSLADFRFERLKSILGDNLRDVSEEELKYILDFFSGYKKKEYSLRSKNDVISIFARGHSALEAHFDLSTPYSLREESRKLFERISALCDEGKVSADEEELFGGIKPITELTPEAVEHLRGFLRLSFA